MADVKVSDLTTATDISTGDYLLTVDGGVSKKVQAGSGGGLDVDKVDGKNVDTTHAFTSDTIPLRRSNGVVDNPQVDLTNGLLYAMGAGMPEYPDNLAGTTYFQDTFATADGWTYAGSGGSVTVSGGQLVLTCGAAGDGFTKTQAVVANRSFRLKISGAGNYGTKTVSIYNGTSETTKTVSISTAPQIIDIYSTLTFANVTIKINDAVASEVYYFDWIYIGTGAYDSKDMDVSGNQRVLTCSGLIPDNVKNSRYFDGVNDYLQGNIVGLNQYATVSFDFDPDNEDATAEVLIETSTNFNNNNGAFGLFYNDTANRRLSIGIRMGAGVAISRYYIMPDTAKHHITAMWDLTQSDASLCVQIYVDGVKVTTTSSVTTATRAASLYNGNFYIGARAGSSVFYPGSIGNFRIYNRILSDAEIWALAKVKDNYYIDYSIKAVSSVPYSTVVRDSVGATALTQVTFPVDAVPSTNPNTLDDYEEGIWEPLLVGSTTAGTQTQTVKFGRYRKIGNTVWIHGYVIITAKDVAMAGNAQVSGLPFVSISTTSANNVMASAYWKGFTFPANYTSFGITTMTNSSTLSLSRSGSGVAPSLINVTEVANATEFIFSGFYFTT